MAPDPQVSVAAIANGSEANGSPAIFRFSRTGSTTDPLSVSYRLLGTAQAGSDYNGATSGTISFSAGSATAELSLPALADSVIDPGETIIAQIVHSTAATPSYLITPGQQTATATITAEGMVVAVNGPSIAPYRLPGSGNMGEWGNGYALAALKSDGTVVSWGLPLYGGTTPAGLGGVTQIFSAQGAFAALKNDGTVVSWGWGNTAATPAGLGGVAKIFSNYNAFAALKSDGTVVCWGLPLFLPYGGTTPAGLGGVTQIFSTRQAFAALKSDGTVFSWGDPSYGGTTPAGLGGVTQIFSNTYAFAALKSDGSVVSWGSPSQGGTTPAGLGGVTQISSTTQGFAALKSDGTVVSWGYPTSLLTAPTGLSGVTQIFSNGTGFAALKSDGTVVSWGWSNTAATPAGLGSVTQIFSSQRAFAALKSDGTVVSWGYPSDGGTTPAGLSGVTQIFSTGTAFAALKSDGSVVSWGSPSQGGTTPAGLSGVTQIFSSGNAFAALKSDGTVVSWGYLYGGTTPAGLGGVVGFADPFTDDRLLLSTTTAAVTAITDDVGIIQGTVASGASTDDKSLTISGTLFAALRAGEVVRIYDGSTFLGNATVSGTTWRFADSRTLTDTQSVSYTARVADAAGNLSAAGSAYSATVDLTAPTGSLNPIAPVRSTTADGSYGIGAVINLTVQFSEAVFVNTTAGTPRLQLETGAVDRYAVYTGGSGANTLSFSYTVQAGDSSADLDQVSSSALELNGGTIRDAAGNNANFLLAEPGVDGSLGVNAALVIDGVAPTTTAAVTAITDNVGMIQGTLASGATTDDTSLSISGTISATLAAGETVRIYDGTTLLGSAAVSGTNWSYADTRILSNNQSVSYAARVANAVGNQSAAGSVYSFTVDISAPTGSLNPIASVRSTTADGSYGIGAVINLAVQFSEAVFVNTTTGTPRLQLETGAVDRYAVYTGGSGTNTLSFSYTVQAGDSSADLDQVSSSALELNGGTIRDAAGNNANFSLATPGAVGSLAANAAIVIATAHPNSHLFSTVTKLEWDQDLDSFITGTTFSAANFMLAEVSGTGRPFQGDKDGNLNAKTWEKVRFGDLSGKYLPTFADSSYYYYYGAVNTGSLGGWGLFLVNQNDEFYLLDVDGNCNLSPGINVSSWDSWLPNTYYFETNVVCFLAGTLIATPTGERPIESLQPGDLISTAEGPQPVRFLARSTRSIAQLQALGKMPIRINQGALGCLGPAQYTFMSPSHAIHFAGSLVEAGAMINGTSIQQLNDWPDAALTYYNIELERHGLITANGLLVESYFANYRSNGFSRDCWDNYHDYVALYGAGELMEELPLPRIPFARQIPMQLRQSLQLHEDNYKAAKPAIATSGMDQFACLCL